MGVYTQIEKWCMIYVQPFTGSVKKQKKVVKQVFGKIFKAVSQENFHGYFLFRRSRNYYTPAEFVASILWGEKKGKNRFSFLCINQAG